MGRKQNGRPDPIGTPVLYICEVKLPLTVPGQPRLGAAGNRLLEGLYVRSLQALGTLGDFEFNRLAIIQRLVAISHDRGEMDENVLTGLALDEPKALAGIEPLHCTLFFTHCFTLFRAAERPHNIKLSDASSPEPLNRAAAVFKPRPAGPQSGPQNKKIGRKCDLATALQPKGDTRATNANTDYHIALLFPNTFFGLVTPPSLSAWDAFSRLRVARRMALNCARVTARNSGSVRSICR